MIISEMTAIIPTNNKSHTDYYFKAELNVNSRSLAVTYAEELTISRR